MTFFKLPPLCKFRNLMETMNILISVLHTMIFQSVLRRQPRWNTQSFTPIVNSSICVNTPLLTFCKTLMALNACAIWTKFRGEHHDATALYFYGQIIHLKKKEKEWMEIVGEHNWKRFSCPGRWWAFSFTGMSAILGTRENRSIGHNDTFKFYRN